MVNVYKRRIVAMTETLFAIQTHDKPTARLYGKSACGCNNNAVTQKELFSDVDVCRARWPGSGHASVTFANVAIWRHVKSNIRVKYHEIVAWWSGVAYMYLVCVSLDIALIGTLQCACLPKPLSDSVLVTVSLLQCHYHCIAVV